MQPKSKKRDILSILFVVLLVIHIYDCYRCSQDRQIIPGVNPGSTVVFHTEMDCTNRITGVDATEEYIFFAYSGYGVVSAYRWNGDYQFSLAFYSDTNGTLTMGCKGNLLYVEDYAGYDFILDGENVVDVLSPEETEHTLNWYIDSEPIVTCHERKVFDKNGNFIMYYP